jgi:uncharacterized protein YjeT (DUF2065 family)
MDETNSIFVERSRRIRNALTIAGALVLFLAGLLLLLAPVSARHHESRTQPLHFPDCAIGWIMGAQSHEPGFLAGG